ncbi:DUF4062 domain-containing protein [Candidatus Bathyarchaeota archaeon]|nr:DUF4062 domain-containing protein [Candidatus Bathyarchaeota archaeon]
MARDTLDVFVSSDQIEFGKLRRQLSDEICNIPFLRCRLLEDTGADPSTVLDASLRAVRNSDLYVGVFGREYSEITIREYREAVKFRKPCLTYVKNLRKRDERLAQFIDNVLRNDFKYFTFKSGAEVTGQLNVDLHNFILVTLKMGLEERARKKEEAIGLISEEEKGAQIAIQKQDPLTGAEVSFKEGKDLECLVMTSVIIETTLRRILEINGVSDKSTRSLGEMITVAKQRGLFGPDFVSSLRQVSIYRNDAVHLGKIPNREAIQKVMDIARHLTRVLMKGLGVEGSKTASELWKPLPNIVFNVTQRLLRTLTFPQVGWEAYNDSPYQLKVRIEVHPILGGKDLHPLPDDDINGTYEYPVEPRSALFGNGCFSLPQRCATSKEELILEIRATVLDVNDTEKSEYKMLPSRWKYVREHDAWSYYPQRPKTP